MANADGLALRHATGFLPNLFPSTIADRLVGFRFQESGVDFFFEIGVERCNVSETDKIVGRFFELAEVCEGVGET